MKNFVKISLFGLVVGVTTLSTYMYAACNTVPGIGTICGNGDVCNNAGGCLCNGNNIALGATCSNIIAPPTDGVVGTMTFGDTCSDGDGCSCSTPTGILNISYGQATCTWDITLPVLSVGSINVNNNIATLNFSSTKAGTISYNGSCGNGNLSSAIIGNNNTNFTLGNGTYNNCQLKVTDSFNNSSIWLSIPSFIINVAGTVTPPVTSTIGSVGGGSTTCYSKDLVCENGKYVKKPGVYCINGNLGNACVYSLSTFTGELYNIISTIPKLTYTGFESLVDEVKNNTKYSSLKEYTLQGIKIKIYTPKFVLKPIALAINSLTKSFIAAVDKKLIRLNDYSYVIENYETIGTDQKIIVYKEIGAMTRLYNDMMATLYMVLDMKKTELLPVAKYYLTTYINEIIKFKK